MTIMETEADLFRAVEDMIERDRYRPESVRWCVTFEHSLRVGEAQDYQWFTRTRWFPSQQAAAAWLRDLQLGRGVLGQQLRLGLIRLAALGRAKYLIPQDKPDLDSI